MPSLGRLQDAREREGISFLFFLNFIFCIQLVIFSTTFHDCSDCLCFTYIQYLNVGISFASVTLLYLMSILPLVSLLQ